MKSGNGRLVDDVWGKVMAPEPPSNPSIGDNGAEGTARMVSRYASVQLAVRPRYWPPAQHIVPPGRPLELLPPDFLASLERPAPSRWPLPPLEHGPQPGDAGLYEPCCPLSDVRLLCLTRWAVLMPPYGERHVLAHSFSIGGPRPKRPLIHGALKTYGYIATPVGHLTVDA